ncbi:glutaminase A [Spongisporangium articulatum]|uniref:Glutaminase n=1 Tax=Spongisporangium articulatum TaxID=3362603 RepID=A0ABW8AJ70_9ACTN
MLSQVHEVCSQRTDGEVATYIPQLAYAPPEAFGIGLATLDGHVYETGDSRLGFSIQSVSKPFVYALALADHGLEGVLQRIGVEPTGDPFNSITVDEETARPFNPMVNAGAIVAASLVKGTGVEEKFERIRNALSAFAGRELTLDERVYNSENETGDRNRAIAYFMRTMGALEGDVDEVLEVYFKQCSLLVTARDLAVMSATLSNGGRNPVTGEVAIEPEHVSRVLAVMSTCGMYDYAGEWMYRVGLPAKSGVSGGIAVALSQRLGIGLYSPRLDRRGNSVRGIAACEELSQRLGLHVLRADASTGPPALRRRTGADIRSKRVRSAAQLDTLTESGSRIVVFELLSDQTFLTAETLMRKVLSDNGCQWAVIDLHRVTQTDTAAARLLTDLVRQRGSEGKVTAVIASPELTLRELMESEGAVGFDDLDEALEWAENELLTEGEHPSESTASVPLAEQELLAGMTEEALGAIAPLLVETTFKPREIVFDEGEEADAIYFISSGEAAVVLSGDDGRRWTRLATVAAGSAFGDLAALDGGTRSSRVVADTEMVTQSLMLTDLAALRVSRPDVVGQLYQAMARTLAERLRSANREISALRD